MKPDLKAIRKQADRWSDLACDIFCDELGTAAENTIPELCDHIEAQNARIANLETRPTAADVEAAFRSAYDSGYAHASEGWDFLVDDAWRDSNARRKLEEQQ